MKNKFKRFGVDLAGYGLILLGLLTGWLPGPGGIPLILAGLGLLSIHNKWAHELIQFIKLNGKQLMIYLFPNNKKVQFAHDIFVILLLGLTAFCLFKANGYFYQGLGIALAAIAMVDFFYNRHRGAKLKQWLGKHK